MAGKMKKRKESHLINDLVIVVAIGFFGFFLWYSSTSGGRAATKQRTPKMTLEAFIAQYRKVKADLFRPDLATPSGKIPEQISEINPKDGWKGLEHFFKDEDLLWLRDNTNMISLAWALQNRIPVDEWKKRTVWERHIMARQAMFEGAPSSDFTAQPLKEPDKQGTQEMQISVTGGASLNIVFAKQGGAWRIIDFFGNRGRYQANAKAILAQMPPNMR